MDIFRILCINCRRRVVEDHDFDSLCSCIFICFPILCDKINGLGSGNEGHTLFVPLEVSQLITGSVAMQ